MKESTQVILIIAAIFIMAVLTGFFAQEPRERVDLCTENKLGVTKVIVVDNPKNQIILQCEGE